jgi:hypothetical protein
MKYKINCTMLSLLFVVVLHAQLVTNLQIPYMGTYSKSQLWQISLTSATAINEGIKVELHFTDANTGQLIFKGTSNRYFLNQQAALLNATVLSPINYTIYNASYNVDANPEGWLPVGKFTVCCYIFKDDETLPIDSDCAGIEIEPLSPPVLISPGDGEEYDLQRPFFTWIPPAPFMQFSQLSYDLLLVSVDGLQSPSDALQQNIPLLTVSNLPDPSLAFPVSMPALDTGKLYAWRVTANSAGSAVGTSELATFSVRSFTADTVSSQQVTLFFVPLKKEGTSSLYLFEDVVRYQYRNELNDTVGTVSLYDVATGNRVQKNYSEIPTVLKHGDNFLHIDLTDYSGFKDKHVYMLELTNSLQEKWFLKFFYRKP